jgi:ABC-type lipopolysaccharide export system ATPase subunit
MSTKMPECWAGDPNAQALRIEVSSERSLLLPHDQFIFAELTREGDEQNLKLVFATHEVSIRGHHLRRIETIMQRLELSHLSKLPGSQLGLITEGQPVILGIIVTGANPQDKRDQNVSE